MDTKDTVFSLESQRLRQEAKTKRAELARGYDRRLELEVEGIEQRIERLDRDHQHAVDREAKRESEAAERVKQQREELEKQLMSKYIASAPGTTEDEAKAALPDLLHQHRLQHQDHLNSEIAKARNRYRI